MTKIRNFSQQKTLLFVLGVCVVAYLCLEGTGHMFSIFPDSMLKSVSKELFGMLWPVALSLLCGYRFIYTGKGAAATLSSAMGFLAISLFGLCIAVFEAVYLNHAQWQTTPVIIVGLLHMLGVGVREEVIYRGIIANSLALKYATEKKGLRLTVIVSALVFGLIHITNIFHGVGLVGLLAQMISAFAGGLMFTAVYLRGGNIWVLMIIHALIDSAGMFVSTFTVTTVTKAETVSGFNPLGAVVLVCLYSCLAMFLLRKSKQPAIFARLEQLRNQYC